MSVFTRVTREQLVDWLGRFSVGSLREFEGIAAGIENTNYFVTTSQGRYVLTLFEKLGLDELPYYLHLMEHLARGGVPSARPIADRSDALLGTLNGKPAALVTFLPGADVAQPTAEQCAQAGAMLARIHLAGASYPRRKDNPRGPRWWQSVTPEILPFLDGKDAALLESEVRFQSQHGGAELPRGAIHADLFRDNVLWDGGAISGVIDFYFACTGALLYDVAIAANDWCLGADGALDAGLVAALLEAYRGQRPFTSAEAAAWPAMLRAGALRFWVSRLYDFHLPRPGELTHAKDPVHFRRILARHAAGQPPAPGLPL